jgi:hypothetical protein
MKCSNESIYPLRKIIESFCNLSIPIQYSSFQRSFYGKKSIYFKTSMITAFTVLGYDEILLKVK